MMTAEQFYDSVSNETRFEWAHDSEQWYWKFAESYAAAQLAEKEREIANEIAKKNDWRKLAESNQETATKALERLQEAQAEIATWQSSAAERQRMCESLHTDLVALRERLRQREAELEQRWIAVGERLPDEPQHDVLLWTADDWESSTNFQQIGVIGEFNRDEWDGKVTHWQPLPSPPKEANDGT